MKKFDLRLEWLFFKSRVDRRWEKLMMTLAWKLPKVLVKCASLRLMAHATQGEYSDTEVPELDVLTALGRWDFDKLLNVPKTIPRG